MSCSRKPTKGYTDDIQREGFQPLRELPGARIVTAAFIVEQLAAGAATLGW